MTDDPKRGRVARLRQRQAAFTERCTRQFSQPTRTEDLYCGAAWMDHSPELDAQAWCKMAIPRFTTYGVPFGVLAHRLQAFHDNPTAATAKDAAREAEHICHMDFAEFPASGVDLVREAYQRLMLFAWCDGDELAAWHVARIAYAMSKTATDELTRALCRATMLDAIRNPTPYYIDGGGVRERAHAAALLEDAEAGLLAYDLLRARVRNEGAEARRKREAQGEVLKELLSNPAGAVQTDVYQIVLEDIMPEPEVEEPPPGRIVLGSLNHLSSHRDSPRQQHERHSNVPLRCVPAPDASAMADRLVVRYPWAEAAIRRLCGMLVGQRHAAFRNPVLLLGSQGCGKTALMRAVGEAMGVPVTVFACGGVMDNGFAGTSRQFSTHRPSVPAQLMFKSSTATVLVGLDELEKSTHGGHNGSVRDGLLGMIEPSMKGKHFDVCLETDVDLSLVSFFATANSVEPLRGPLLDRFTVIPIPDPRREDLDVIVRGLLDSLRQESGLDPRFIADLDPSERDVLKRAWRGGSIRPLARAVEQIVTLRSSPRLAH
ncbi:AAA family ATPase [Microvirga terrae]|uniref:AAA family ATPase n=1 Tax=Microvirga terrae TaxID=2740529 RepID=A0ABY5RQK5_9HYPH|nr:AAA family ATPase [Microvirga terrae]UVF18477.1 AAA family ATPase [Microvirga terrae]